MQKQLRTRVTVDSSWRYVLEKQQYFGRRYRWKGDLSCQKKLFFRVTLEITAIFAVGRIAEVMTMVDHVTAGVGDINWKNKDRKNKERS